MEEEKKYLDYEGLQTYHENLQSVIEGNERVIAAALDNLDNRIKNIENENPYGKEEIDSLLKPITDKLEDIEEFAEVNVQSDWNQTDTTADDYIKNKPNLNLKVDKTTTINGHELSNNIIITKNDISLNNVTNDSQVKRSEMGSANGVATLDENGIILSNQLPSYVDDVIEAYYHGEEDPQTGEIIYNMYEDPEYTIIITPESGKIYVDILQNVTYRWGGSTYVPILGGITLGETSSTAYRGDRGKIAYDHSQTIGGNPHNVTKTDVGLGNVVNTGDSATPIQGGITKFTTGGAYVELNKKVDKIEGKVLSTNDFTTREKNKLAGIEEGAQVNVQSDWNAISGDTFIKNKPTSLPASDVYSWAKASTKPSYTLDEVSDGNTRKLANYLPLSGGTITGELTIQSGNFKVGVSLDSEEFKYYHALYMGTRGVDHMDFYESVFNFYGNGGGTPTLKVNGNTVYHSGNLTKVSQLTNDSGYITSSGTSTQFLKADGSVDSNTYVTTSALDNNLSSYKKKGDYWIPISGTWGTQYGDFLDFVSTSSNIHHDNNHNEISFYRAARGTNLVGNDSYYMVFSMDATDTRYIKLVAFDSHSARIYSRAKVDNSWSDWYTVAFTTDNVASATKLQTARTLWGQPFDGSGNVSGNMTGVGDITSTKYKIINHPSSVDSGFVIAKQDGTYRGGIAYFSDHFYIANYVNTTENSGISFFDNGNTVIFGNGNVGVGTSDNPLYKFCVNGDAAATNFYTTSDSSKKDNITSLSEHIRKFTLKETGKEHYGVIAQEVEEMFREGEEGSYTVNYNSILSYYVGLLENRVAELENKIKELSNG